MLLELKPSRSLEEVKKLQEEVDEAGTVLRLKGNAPFGGLTDIRKALRRAEIGSILSPAELTEISGLLYAAKQMKHFLEGLFEDGVEIPCLHQYAEKLIPLSELERDINSCIDDHGEVLDHASETLRGIRTQLRTLESRIRDRLESMLRSSSAQKNAVGYDHHNSQRPLRYPCQTGVQIKLRRNRARSVVFRRDIVYRASGDCRYEQCASPGESKRKTGD